VISAILDELTPGGREQGRIMIRMKTCTIFLAAAGALAFAGCASPTYGTGVRADVQLMDDVTNAISLAPPKREKITYAPRPELVRPADKSVLPAPQQNVTQGNAAWPESPEETRARIRAETDANRDNPGFTPLVAPPKPGVLVKNQTPGAAPARRTNPLGFFQGREAKRQEINARIAAQPDNPNRRYLSEPPVEYQQAEQTAATNDIGEDELLKEKRRKRLIKGKKSWRDYLPF
jgi:hypothetical protein